jgi:hypothetical protein
MTIVSEGRWGVNHDHAQEDIGWAWVARVVGSYLAQIHFDARGRQRLNEEV